MDPQAGPAPEQVREFCVLGPVERINAQQELIVAGVRGELHVDPQVGAARGRAVDVNADPGALPRRHLPEIEVVLRQKLDILVGAQALAAPSCYRVGY